MSYLLSLTLRLTAGAARLPEVVRQRHAAYLIACQNQDGGFAGRQGPSDLYYTSFALRALAMLGQLEASIAAKAERFLQEHRDRPLAPMDFVSLLASAVLVSLVSDNDIFAAAGRDLQQDVVDFFAPFRRPDGGFAKTQRGAQSSTYHTFLIAASHEMVGATLSQTDDILRMLHGRHRADGGFVELAPLSQSGTNPTAAAVGLLRLLGALDDPIRTAAAGFLARAQTDQGGLRANTRIPLADLLSTFTGLVALGDLEALAMIDATAAAQFVSSLEASPGGFRAHALDDSVDVEYTFYGLGTLAMLSSIVVP